MKLNWTRHLRSEVYERLCNCQTTKEDIQELVNAKWLSYKESGKNREGLTKEDALVEILDHLDANSQYLDLTRDEYDALKYDPLENPSSFSVKQIAETRKSIYDKMSKVLTDYENGEEDACGLYEMLCTIQNHWEDIITAEE